MRDLFESLEAAGFTVRVQVDAEGVLRGVSFARGDFAFRGSQLGRDLSGSKLLQTFGLAYDPARDAALIEARREVREAVQPVARAEAVALAQRPTPAPEPRAIPAPVPVEPPRAGFPPDPAQERALLEEVGRLRRLFPEAREDRASAVQREALEARPESTRGSRCSPLLAEVEQVRRHPEQADTWAELLSTRELIRGAYHHNREALREIDTGAQAAYHPGPRSMLIAQEAQIEKNQRAAGAHLRQVEEALGGRLRQLEGAAEQASREPGPASTRRWQEAVSEYRQALTDHDRAERTYYGWLHVQAVLDRERARAALVSEPGALAGRAFAAHVMRAERLALEARAYPLAGGRSPGAQGLPSEEVAGRLDAFESGLTQGRSRPTQGEVREAARLYRACQRFERRGDLKGATERSSRHAAQAVVREERTPSSLRRLYTALLREVRPEAVPPPSFAAPKGDTLRLDRLEQLSDGLLRDAAELARLGSKAPEALKVRLLGSTSEAVLLERLLDASDRQAQGIPNPGFAPPGASPTLWRAAWLVAAHQRGLPVERAAGHLANLPSVAVQVSRSPWASAAATIALGALRHYSRKLQEELELSQSRTRSRGLTLG